MPPKKDKKKAKQKQDDYWDTEFQQDAATLDVTTATAEPEQPEAEKPTAVTADPVMDDLSEEFGGLMAAIKKSKGKKGKKQQPVEMLDANEELQAMEVEASPVAAAQNGDAGDTAEKEDEEEEQGGGEFRVKTKKEKEKEKKEKEKAKKKAQVFLNQAFCTNIQADKKKAASAPDPEPEPEPAAEPATEDGAADPEEDEGTEETTAGGYSTKLPLHLTI
jgi:translation initiation factor 5B